MTDERPTADEKRRRAITEWWKRKNLNDFIARIRSITRENIGG